MQFTLIKATNKDYLVIQKLAIEIWNKHYVPIIGQEQVDYMLKKMYSVEAIDEQINTKSQNFYLIESEGAAIGFVSFTPITNGEFWLNKFYVLQQNQAKGFGTKVFKECLQLLGNPSKIKLTVNRQNYKSINFYFKNGFVIEEVADFNIGDGYYMNDFVMVWKA